MRGSWSSPTPFWELGTACVAQQVAESCFFTLSQDGDIRRGAVPALAGPASVCPSRGLAACAGSCGQRL